MIDCPCEIKVFIDKVKRDCENSNFEVFLSEESTVSYGSFKFGGLCDVAGQKISVATGLKTWQSWSKTLVHEYCHFKQFKDETQIYKNMCGNKFLSWADKKVDLSDDKLYFHYKDVQRSEFDCDIRSIKMIEQEKLPLNVEEYKILTNIHMYLYVMMRKLRQPFKGSPYANLELRDYVPHGKLLSLSEYENISPELQKMMIKHCFDSEACNEEK
jgi:hypothetical protein